MPSDERVARHGLDENRNYLADILGKFVPQSIAQRAVHVSVETDKQQYDPGEPIEITAKFMNQLPVPITVRTPRQRLWGWQVNGELEASDEARYTRSTPNSFSFRPRERKQIDWQWNGRFGRTDEGRWVIAEPREYVIDVFIATADSSPSATTTVQIG